MADGTRGSDGSRLVLLDEWVVQAWVEPDLPAPEAEEIRLWVGRELRQRLSGLAARGVVRVVLED